MMRMTIVMLACLVCVSACGGVDTEAIKSDIAKYKKQLAGLNAEMVAMMEKNGPLKTGNYRAMAALKGAQRKGDAGAIAAAQAAYDEASAAAKVATDAEKALDDRITALEDKISALEKKIR